MLYYDVLLPLIFDQPFTYASEEELSVGQVVKVSFRNKMVHGIVVAPRKIEEGIPANIKSIIKVIDFSLVAQELEFIERVSNYNIARRGGVLKQVLPSSIMPSIEKEGWNQQPREEHFSFTIPVLSDDQREIVDKISCIHSHKVHVIDGETGSGKTEVYLSIAKKVIESGKQVLILLPEIVLTKQLLLRFKERVGTSSIEWHSGISVKQKRENFIKIITGNGQFILGARSALFLPFKNLGLIVIDEEHDKSFKQEDNVVYNARDMAVLKAKIFNIPVLLSSATPSLETHYNIQKGKYLSYKLRNRFGGSLLPEVVIVDLNRDKPGRDRAISGSLYAEILNTLKIKKQTLLFLNKRGFAPIVHCGECQTSFTCRNCNALMVYHKSTGKMLCHYCGSKREALSKCTLCENENLIFLGTGVEKLEEEVRHLFPMARVVSMTSDTSRGGKDAEDNIGRIINNEVDIIIGTQILAKGLHFPELHFVAVVDAESNMLGFDIRALERTYQLLHQVAGRAGRMKKRGKVMIQTTQPCNPVIEYLKNFDQEGFLSTELEAREISNMPPFSRLIAVNIAANKDVDAAACAREIKKFIPNSNEVEVIGPAPSPLYFLRNKYRYRLLIKTAKNININSILQRINLKFNSKAVKVSVDVDPQSFL